MFFWPTMQDGRGFSLKAQITQKYKLEAIFLKSQPPSAISCTTVEDVSVCPVDFLCAVVKSAGAQESSPPEAWRARDREREGRGAGW